MTAANCRTAGTVRTTRSAGKAAALATLLATTVGAQAGNVLQTNVSSLMTPGVYGSLRAGSPWGPGSTPAQPSHLIDGVFMPENTQWNNGSLWWDEDPTVNPGPISMSIILDGTYTINRFVMQADDNDSYRIEWWDGGNWQLAWDVAAVFTFGLVTRDSGVLGTAITTDRLRLTATGGDNYYAISEVQAFTAQVPEPGTWALVALALLGLGSQQARRRRG